MRIIHEIGLNRTEKVSAAESIAFHVNRGWTNFSWFASSACVDSTSAMWYYQRFVAHRYGIPCRSHEEKEPCSKPKIAFHATNWNGASHATNSVETNCLCRKFENASIEANALNWIESVPATSSGRQSANFRAVSIHLDLGARVDFAHDCYRSCGSVKQLMPLHVSLAFDWMKKLFYQTRSKVQSSCMRARRSLNCNRPQRSAHSLTTCLRRFDSSAYTIHIFIWRFTLWPTGHVWRSRSVARLVNWNELWPLWKSKRPELIDLWWTQSEQCQSLDATEASIAFVMTLGMWLTSIFPYFDWRVIPPTAKFTAQVGNESHAPQTNVSNGGYVRGAESIVSVRALYGYFMNNWALPSELHWTLKWKISTDSVAACTELLCSPPLDCPTNISLIIFIMTSTSELNWASDGHFSIFRFSDDSFSTINEHFLQSSNRKIP